MADVAALQQEMFESIQGQNWDRLRELFHPDYQYTDVDGSVGGADEAVTMARGYTDAFPDLVFEVRNQFSAGESSCMEVTVRGTNTGPLQDIPATGRRIEMTGCNVVVEKDGLIWREADYFDTFSMLKKLGVIED